MTALVIRDLDPTDDADFHAFQVVYERALAHRTSHLPPHSEEASRPYFLPRPGGRRAVSLVACERGETVGQAVAFCPPVGDPDPECFCQVNVDPAHMRRGVGGALVEALLDRVRAEGLTLASADVALPPGAGVEDGYVRFAERHGWRFGNLEITRQLTLPVPDELLEALTAEAAPHHADYRLDTYVGRVPDDVVEGYLRLNDLVRSEAPTGDMEVPDAPMSREEFEAAEQGLELSGVVRLLTIARTAQGEAVGSTNLVVQPDGLGRQGGTIVRRDHRGHRLGLALKAANLRRLQAGWPDLRMVQSQNAATNAHMVGINDRLGFVPVAGVVEMQRRV